MNMYVIYRSFTIWYLNLSTRVSEDLISLVILSIHGFQELFPPDRGLDAARIEWAGCSSRR